MGRRMTVSKQLKQRILFGSLGLFLIAISIYYSYSPYFKPLFVILNAGIGCLALNEYFGLAKNKGLSPIALPSLVTTLLYFAAISLTKPSALASGLPTFTLLCASVVFFLIAFNERKDALTNVACTFFGIGYLIIPLSCILRINYFFPEESLQDGRLWLAYVLLVSKITDIGAYFAGKILGKNKLAPLISPQKTIEGSIGGITAALCASLLFVWIFSGPAFRMNLFDSIWLGLIISVMAQLGDLSESLLKRDAGVKDSSHLPGLGGMLDVVDSLVFTLPLMYLLLEMHIVG